MNTTDVIIRCASAVALYFLFLWYVRSEDSARLTKMATRARARTRAAYAAAAGYFGREFFRVRIPGTDGIGRIVGASGGLKSYRKSYPTLR